jgi:hypothetical protein
MCSSILAHPFSATAYSANNYTSTTLNIDDGLPQGYNKPGVVPTLQALNTIYVSMSFGYCQIEEVSSDTFSSCNFYADPGLEIDPTWLAANPGYSIVASPLASIPEPSVWVMLLMGLGALGAKLRRARCNRMADLGVT